MTASRAIEAAQARLDALRDEEARLQGALSEVTRSAREVPAQFAASVRQLISNGELQRRWDWAQQRAERGNGTPEEALLSTITGFLDEVAEVVLHRVLGDCEMAVRHRAEAIAAERRTLEWVVAEAKKDSVRPPPPPGPAPDLIRVPLPFVVPPPEPPPEEWGRSSTGTGISVPGAHVISGDLIGVPVTVGGTGICGGTMPDVVAGDPPGSGGISGGSMGTAYSVR